LQKTCDGFPFLPPSRGKWVYENPHMLSCSLNVNVLCREYVSSWVTI